MDIKMINELALEYGPSFYLFNIRKLRENYRKIENAFKCRYQNFIIGYSYKTNYLPHLCMETARLGGYAEVVSRLEYELALKIGVRPQKIIYNGPGKTKEDIEIALLNESMLNIDSLREILLVEEICKKHEHHYFKVGLRANFAVSDAEGSLLQEGFPASRFGICVENGEFELAVNQLKNISNVEIVGLHGHFSTRNRSIQAYEMITKTLCELAKEYVLDSLEYIDIGGGIYGELPKDFRVDAPSFDDYAEAICTIMNQAFDNRRNKPYLVLEPGMSMVANTFIFVAKVMDVKNVRGSTFVLVDGSVHNIKPTMHKRNLPVQILTKGERSYGTYHIVGYTCMEKDYLAYGLQEKIPQVGDYIIFENVGAYTIVFNPPFIKERPGIVAKDGEKNFLVRKKETIKEFFNEDVYCF